MTKSIGMMKFPIYGKITFMFQTINQILWFSYGFPMVFLRFSYAFASPVSPSGASQGARCTPPAPAQLSLASLSPPVPRRLHGLRGVAPTNRGQKMLTMSTVCNKNLTIMFGIHIVYRYHMYIYIYKYQ